MKKIELRRGQRERDRIDRIDEMVFCGGGCVLVLIWLVLVVLTCLTCVACLAFARFFLYILIRGMFCLSSSLSLPLSLPLSLSLSHFSLFTCLDWVGLGMSVWYDMVWYNKVGRAKKGRIYICPFFFSLCSDSWIAGFKRSYHLKLNFILWVLASWIE